MPWAAAALLFGCWLACLSFGDAQDPYGLFGWFGTGVDGAPLGANHRYRGEGIAFDPEGLASTPPAVAQVLLGWWVGEAVVRQGKLDAALVSRLFAQAALLAVAAYAWQLAMPLYKKISTGGGSASASRPGASGRAATWA